MIEAHMKENKILSSVGKHVKFLSTQCLLKLLKI